MIVVEHLAKRFGTVHALQDVSFTAQDGRITGLLGANGAGKSTTLRIIATTLKTDGGVASVDGFDCASRSLDARSKLGVLPHSSGLYPNLTARENIRYFAQLHLLPNAVIEQRIGEWAARLDMAELLDRRTKGFSQGQKLKVALARALIHNPRNIILDEPTNGLDIGATRALRDLIRNLRDEGCCILLSSHIMQEVSALCDDIVIVAQGCIAAMGTPEQILNITGAGDLEGAFMHASGLQGDSSI
jgi:sodium transport system ATP-binding protein